MSKYKVGDRFTIEVQRIRDNGYYLIGKRRFENVDVEMAIPEHTLDVLAECSKQIKTYEDGLVDAWEAARMIHENPDRIKKIFDNPFIDDILNSHAPQAIVAKIKAYEDSKEIRRGDEVTPLHGANIKYGKKGIVFKESCVSVRVVWEDKDTTKIDKSLLTKTGRNFADKLDALLGEIGAD